MGNLPNYIINEEILSRLNEALQVESLNVEKCGQPKIETEGTDQNWRCFDESGDLFFFSVVEINKSNALKLEIGSLLLALGPSGRGSGSSEAKPSAFERFERILINSGAQKRS